ncbi:MAG: DUF2752 domain-containing protein [Planctomycetaceae bacterium]|nr:DUF2752 domain-containing protein [Planctomycetaceae bacterium]MCA9042856.1 DUF2752 domain-containing protein [Planctomycetaceae bacterium]
MQTRVEKSPFDVLFGPFTKGFSLVALLLSFFLPVDGLSVQVCWVKNLFNLPCPGCGLTRSVTCISHFEFLKAWQYHPFGFVLYPLFVLNLIVLCSPVLLSHRLRNYLDRHRRFTMSCYLTACGLFLVYGIVRMGSQPELWLNVVPR